MGACKSISFSKFIGLDVLVRNYLRIIKKLQALNIFETSLRRGKFDESRKCVHLINNSFSIVKVFFILLQ